MDSLRDIWLAKGFTSTSLAAACSVTAATIYRMNRKEPVHQKTIICVCKKLGISIRDYEQIPPCPQADRYRS